MYTLALILGNVSQHWEVRFSACFSLEHAFLFGGKIMYEKGKILAHKLIWFVLLIITIVVSIVFWLTLPNGLWYILVMMLDAFVPLFFICALLLSCKIYRYNGMEIIVYAGWYHHYIKVSGVLVDTHNTILSYTPIVLSATLEDGTELQATISLTNRISLKINNKLYLKEI